MFEEQSFFGIIRYLMGSWTVLVAWKVASDYTFSCGSSYLFTTYVDF